TFDLATLNYTQKDLNGKTSLISQAATCAARTGMLVVSSMGNFYSPEPFWTKMRMPADADSIVSVGAVNANEEYVALSLQGYTEDSRVKPDAAAMGLATFYLTVNGNVSAGSGTSYAAPLVAGLAAGLWQANPQMTNIQVLQAIRRAGSRFNSPNTQLGYGIPTFRRAMNILGIDEELNIQTNIYPTIVAADNTVFCQFPTELQQSRFSYQVTDVTGKIHYQADNQIVDSETISLKISQKSLPAGIYFLNIHINNKTIYRKIISYQ
ncbi:MAG: S8 family peptidase, partial [Thermoflexibacteraceae bacterium]